jgi:putative phage-type endonuclease
MDELRSKGIGGTDIAAIYGLHPTRDAWTVYAEKTGLLERVVDATNARMRWGKLLERAIVVGYSEITTHETEWVDRTMQNPERPWQVWTPDALGVGAASNRGVDAKNVSWDQIGKWGERGTDDTPQHIVAQCQWYLSASGRRAWDVPALFGGNDLRIYTVLPDPEIEAALLEEGDRFWRDNVLPRVAPPMGNSPAVAEYLKQRFPRNVAAIRQATDEEMALVSEYLPARTDHALLGDRLAALENRIKAAIGDADGFTFQGGKITWTKDRDTTGTDWEAVARELAERAGATAEELDEMRLAHQVVTRRGPRKLRVSVK